MRHGLPCVTGRRASHSECDGRGTLPVTNICHRAVPCRLGVMPVCRPACAGREPLRLGLVVRDLGLVVRDLGLVVRDCHGLPAEC